MTADPYVRNPNNPTEAQEKAAVELIEKLNALSPSDASAVLGFAMWLREREAYRAGYAQGLEDAQP